MAALAVYEDKDDDLDFLDDLNDLIDNDDDSEDDTALGNVKQPSRSRCKDDSLKRPTALRENVLGQNKNNRLKNAKKEAKTSEHGRIFGTQSRRSSREEKCRPSSESGHSHEPKTHRQKRCTNTKNTHIC